jgi:Transthyretin-like family
MHSQTTAVKLTLAALAISGMFLATRAFAADIKGQVMGGGAPIAQSTVTLWAASSDAPRKLAQTKTDNEGRFEIRGATAQADASLYLVATGGEPGGKGGDNPAIALLAVVGGKPPANIVIDEMTTLASVVTHTQFIEGAAIQGSPLQLRIAGGNVPNFVDLETGDYGPTMLDALNSAQTPTMANFATLSSILAACVTRLKSDACSSLFYVATSPTGAYPKDTLAAVEAVVRYPSYHADKVFELLNYFYPLPPPNTPGKLFRPTPFLPYLTFAPSAWIFPLKFTGGGYSGGGKLMIDSEGNAWVADNFTVGAENQDASWTGGLTKLAPNGKPLSPSPLGFRGGGIAGPGFGLTLDAQDNAWATSFTGQNITKFDKNGKPLSPPEGWNFNRQISQMQGIIATPSGDIWTLDLIKGQVVKLPQGDPSKAQFFCQNKTGDPLKNPCKLIGPFALAIDQQDRIWVTNAITDQVVRFSASDPEKFETFKVGYSASGLAVDSLGNVWVTNKLGSSPKGALKFAEVLAAFKFNFDNDPDPGARATKVLVPAMTEEKSGYEGGSITVLRPDGTEASFSPVYGKGIVGPWAVSVDGNDNIWISNFSTLSNGIVELCGFRTEHCPPSAKTGDAISPPGGYVGGGLQLMVDVGIGPAGDVWVTNNWQVYQDALGKVDEALQTQGAGQGVVVFYGMAKPVKTPLIGPAKPY